MSTSPRAVGGYDTDLGRFIKTDQGMTAVQREGLATPSIALYYRQGIVLSGLWGTTGLPL